MAFLTAVSFEAPPEIVFDVLIDPVGMSRWLPDQVVLNPAGRARLEVALDADIAATSDRSRLTYLREPQAAFVVHVTVTALPAGGSQIDLAVEPDAGCEEMRLPQLVDQALAGLHSEVSERFTTG
jgi:hypothetical protein